MSEKIQNEHQSTGFNPLLTLRANLTQYKNENTQLSEAHRNLTRHINSVTKKQQRIDQAMANNRSRHILRIDFIMGCRILIQTVALGLLMNGILWGLFSRCFDETKQKEAFISGYSYKYAQAHNMEKQFNINLFLMIVSLMVGFICVHPQSEGFDASERKKAIRRNIMCADHVKYMAYSVNIDCAGLDYMYSKLDDPNYRRELLRLVHGLSAQDPEYLNEILNRTYIIKNKPIATQIIRGHLAQNPYDITKLKTVLGSSYIPDEVREMYTRYINAKSEKNRDRIAARIQRKTRD